MPRAPRTARGGAMLTVLVLAAGCATYAPAPLDVREVARQQSRATFDADAAATVLTELAPDYVWDRVAWNDLTLFAATLATNPQAASARTTLLAAEAAAQASSVAPGPSISLTTEYALNAPESSPWLVGVLGDTLLDVGGVRQARIESADIAAQQARLDFGRAIWQLRMSLRRALLAWHDGTESVALLTELRTHRQAQFDATLHRVEAGEIPRADLERVRGDLAAANEALSTARGARERSIIDLATVIGVRTAALESITTEPLLPLSRLPAALPENTVDTALANRSEILKAIADYDLAESAYRGAVAAQFPSVHVGAGYVWERGLKKIPGAMTLSLPSWDLNAAAIRAAQAAREDSAARLEVTVAMVAGNVQLAQADYLASRAAAAVAEGEVVSVAAHLAAQADRELAAGWINRADWAAAQAGLSQARLDLLNAESRVRGALLSLEDALQMPLAGPETEIGAAGSGVAK